MELKKRIAVLCDYCLMPERVGGMDRFFWLFDAECKALGYEIVWFFPNESDHEGYINLTVIAANGKSIEQTFLNHRQPFDLIFTHFLELCTLFYQQVKKQKLVTKIVAIDHNPRPFAGYPLKKRIQKRVKGLLYSRYIDLFVGVSQYTVHEIIKDFGSHLERKSKIVYNGIAYEQFKKRTDRNLQSPTFLVACHLRYSKGIQDLIAAVALLPQPILLDLKIDIYGEGDYQSVLEGLINRYHLYNNFVFKGSVSNLYTIYHQYDYLLQPTHMECFSLAILESLSANVPVITTPVGGNEEVIATGVNGFILPVQNPQAWCDLLEQLFYGNNKIITYTSSLIEREFSIEKMVANYVALINEK
jgi:glycosyltransferase involved in cell wall biosynthesis